jgi:hypothetical protein
MVSSAPGTAHPHLPPLIAPRVRLAPAVQVHPSALPRPVRALSKSTTSFYSPADANNPCLVLDVSSPSHRQSVLSRFGRGNADVDPSIQQARERVMSAEKAESEADRALVAARVRVREAREEVKRLELEAAEEARRAKIKQYHAREVSKRGKQLGRKLTPFLKFPQILEDFLDLTNMFPGHDL